MSNGNNGLVITPIILLRTVAVQFDDAIVISVHSPYIGYTLDERRNNAIVLLHYAKELADIMNLPVIVGGDWNTNFMELEAPEEVSILTYERTDINDVDGIACVRTTNLQFVTPFHFIDVAQDRDIHGSTTLDLDFDIRLRNYNASLTREYLHNLYLLGGCHIPFICKWIKH